MNPETPYYNICSELGWNSKEGKDFREEFKKQISEELKKLLIIHSSRDSVGNSNFIHQINLP